MWVSITPNKSYYLPLCTFLHLAKCQLHIIITGMRTYHLATSNDFPDPEAPVTSRGGRGPAALICEFNLS